MAHHNLHGGGHHKNLGNAKALNEIEHLVRIKFARHHALGPIDQTGNAPARAANMKGWHGDQRNIIGRPGIPAWLASDPAKAHQALMRQHGALGIARRTGRVKLQGHIARLDIGLWVLGVLRISPSGKTRPGRANTFQINNLVHRIQGRHQALNQLNKFSAHEQDLGAGIIEDINHLRPGQSPIDRGHDNAGLGRAKYGLEIKVAVLANIGHPRARL